MSFETDGVNGKRDRRLSHARRRQGGLTPVIAPGGSSLLGAPMSTSALDERPLDFGVE
ncbi:hypothetical protein [Prosthecobacter sp.]|uniref:hypothetical protein n=1 Tax=Prosthecobacter sp. TaxID=1965333 RepID=UPI003783910D